MNVLQRCVATGREFMLLSRARSAASTNSISQCKNKHVFRSYHSERQRPSLWAPRVPSSRRHAARPFGQQKRTVFIKTESTPNPESLKFIPEGEMVMGTNAPQDFPTAMSAVKSPLAKRLFRNDGIKRVYLGPDFVSVTKDPDYEWDQLKGLIFAELSEFYQSGEPVVSDAAPPADTQIQPEDSEIVAMIKELLETRIRPGLQDDGGDITYLGFVDNVVFVKMQGSCSGCPSSTTTVKQGVERMLQHWIPEVNGVVAVSTEEEYEQLISSGTVNPPDQQATSSA